MKQIKQILILVAIIMVAGCVFFKKKPKEIVKTEVVTKTEIVRDTIRDTILIEKFAEIIRVDTILLPSLRDTVLVAVEIPITQKTYHTDAYKAVIEGYKPELKSMELYTQKEYIYTESTIEIKDNPKFSLSSFVGAGVVPQQNGKVLPFAGLEFSYNMTEDLSFSISPIISENNAILFTLKHKSFSL